MGVCGQHAASGQDVAVAVCTAHCPRVTRGSPHVGAVERAARAPALDAGPVAVGHRPAEAARVRVLQGHHNACAGTAAAAAACGNAALSMLHCCTCCTEHGGNVLRPWPPPSAAPSPTEAIAELSVTTATTIISAMMADLQPRRGPSRRGRATSSSVATPRARAPWTPNASEHSSLCCALTSR